MGYATTATSMDRGACAGSGARSAGLMPATFAQVKQQQLVFTLVRQLAEAQFVRADRELTRRLWEEVAALEIDPDRITALLYGGQPCDDREALMALDANWSEPACVEPRAGFRWAWGGRPPARPGRISPQPHAGGRRSAPPATLPARR
ncbi:hypothetical protein KQ304_04570 [Synechococcus sp. CS-1329]|uniref:hypothetical protein n=1 Tax=Synechococcus sp. CS-1329 TaxID=2847975 RepID=UPI00223AAD21|nr:hypothetical protein [Synechococcus sp. CS-1329]MCT0218280.1 hypothetical protein [Synechococcus sp. CS-1329]